MSRCKDTKYLDERLRRTYERKLRRKNMKRENRRRYGRASESTCDHCGGIMTWCYCCQCWTRLCCVEYGTCECS